MMNLWNCSIIETCRVDVSVHLGAELRGRALHPAVIARKVSQCSKNTRGAEAFAAFTSVIRTLMKSGVGSVVDALAQLLHPPHPQHLPT